MPNIRCNELTLSVPAGWVDATQVVALGPVLDGFRSNVVVSREPLRAGESVDKFAARQLAGLRQSLQQFALVKEGPAKFGVLSGFLRQHTFAMNGRKLQQLQFYVTSGGVGYSFTFTDLATRSTARSTAEQVFGSAKLG